MLHRIERVIAFVENSSVCVAFISICVATTAQVVFRFVLNLPLAWTEEVAVLSFVWAALLGAAIAVRECAHIGVDTLTRLLPLEAQRILSAVTILSMLALAIALAKLGMDLVHRIGDQKSAAMGVPMVVMYLSLPVTASLMAFHFFVQLRAVLGRI